MPVYHVRLAHSAIGFETREDEILLAAGLRQHLALPFGCQSGTCGSCRVRLVSGRVKYSNASGPKALSDAEIAAGYILMCQTQARSDLTLRLHQPETLEELRPRQWTAQAVAHRALSHDVIGLWVQLPPGESFRFLPGQYVDFLLNDGRRRSFSIASAETPEGILEFHLRVTPGGLFTHSIQDDGLERAPLSFEGPLGAFYLREESTRPALLMAGGTGFGPIQAMLERSFKNGQPRSFHLFWGARARRDLYLDSLVQEWTARHPNFHYTPVLSEPDADWTGERGLVHEALLRAYPTLAGYEVYMAGPPAMVHAGKQAFTAAGLDADHLHYDSFDYAFETWPALEKKPA
ncbi:MAG: 2Fe-2S iron-sulfur cluster-binding protein [Nevskiales bacterium]|nr:2Fe-2S iron-sulfur cluster-binding protein [Nevskiales bacterium]